MSDFFNNNIKKLRERSGYTQKQLASLVGTDDTSISKYETGEICPSIKTLFRMAELFRVTPEQLMGVKPLREYNGIEERLLNLDDGEVVRGEFMSRVNDEYVTLTPDGIRFSTNCIRSWEDTDHIHLIIDEKQQLLIIRKSEKDDPNSQRWSNKKDDKRYGRKITGREFGKRLYKMMKWSFGYSHRINGYLGANEADPSEKLWYFQLDQSEAFPLMRNTRRKMGINDEDIEDKDIVILEKIEEKKTEELRERAKIKEEGKEPGPMTKYVFYPDEWGQYTFGVPLKNTKKRPTAGL